MSIGYSYMFVPALKAEAFLQKFCSGHYPYASPYSLIFDLEDSIPDGGKKIARRILASGFNQYLHKVQNMARIFVRVNAVHSDHFEDDMKWFNDGKHAELDVMLSKCASVEHLVVLKNFVKNINCIVLPLVETLRGYEQRNNIMEYISQKGWALVAFGAGDMSLELGISRNYELTILKHIIMELLITAKRFGIYLIDSPSRVLPSPNTEWDKAVREECAWGCNNGFFGKLAVHPAQVEIINNVYLKEQEITKALNVLEEFRQSSGRRAIRSKVTGNYMGAPVIKQAQEILKNIKPKLDK